MSEAIPDIRIYPDLDALSEAAAEFFTKSARAAVATTGRFTVALAGGSTPRPMYERLAAPPFGDVVPWPGIRVFWGDERCLPPDHPDSNYRMAREALLSRVSIPSDNIYRMAGERPPDAAAAGYAETLCDVFRLAEGELPRFDLILLGMGSDGHTASLFPGTDVLTEEEKPVASHSVDKLATDRLTLTLPTINNAAHVVFLVAGEGKAETLQRVLEGSYEPANLPSQLIRPTHGRLTWLIDEAAASRLDRFR